MSAPATGVYLAASYSRKHELRAYAERINALPDYYCTSSWLDEPDQPHNVYTPHNWPQHAYYAYQDLRDIDESGIVACFTAPDPTVPSIGGGRHFELGYAFARGKHLALIGPEEIIFHHLSPFFRYPDFDAFLADLK